MELHAGLLGDGPPGELRGRALVCQDATSAADEVPLPDGVRRVHAVFFAEEFQVGETVDGNEPFAVHQ